MIEVKYAGRMGNNLFQYSLGRILAEELGFELKAPPIAGFPNTAARIAGHSSEAPIQTLRMHEIEFEKILSDTSPRRIVLDGFFQRYEYYRPFKNKIREWLSPEAPMAKRHPKDIVLHVRKSDYLECRSIAPFSFYEEALSRGQWNQVYVCTDDPKDPFMKLFVKKFKAIVRHSPNDPLSDFKFIMSFNNIVQSASSFSWWAAFLSEAERIYTPIPLSGFWSSETPDLKLTVDDESRYIYIPCKELYRETLKEKAFLLRLHTKRRAEHVRDRVRDRVCHAKNVARTRARNLKARVVMKLMRMDNFNSPQVSGEKFKKLAHWHYDVKKPKKALPSRARLLFCETHNAPLIFDMIRHRKQKYVLMTHDSDNAVDNRLLALMPDNLLRWFSQNADVAHPKVEGLPIGMANTGWEHAKYSRLRKIINERIEKKDLAYLCVNTGSYRTHRERIYELFRDKKFVTLRGGQQPIPVDDFIREVASHRFILSPRGNGIDCHRTWEALYLGSTPVVERSLAMRYFEALPILFINDFSEVTKEFLERSEETLKEKNKDLKMITFDYWKEKILKAL